MVLKIIHFNKSGIEIQNVNNVEIYKSNDELIINEDGIFKWNFSQEDIEKVEVIL